MTLIPRFITTLLILCAIPGLTVAQNSIQLLLTEGQFEKVVNHLEANEHVLSDNDTYYLALAYQQLGYYNKAIDCLAGTKQELNKQQRDLLCRCYLTTGDYTKALPIVEKTYAASPLNTSNLLRYAEINNFYKSYDANIRLLEDYCKEDSSNYNINIFLAESYEKAKRKAEAIATYQMILEQHPNNQKIALRLANLYYGNKQYVECHDLCVPYIERLEKNNNFLLIAGMANFNNGSNHNVLVMFKRLEAQGDSSFLTKKHLGIASYRLENYDHAIDYLHAAFEIKSDDPEVAFFLGASLGQSNTPLKGRHYLWLAQELIKPSPSLMEKINVKLAMIHYDAGQYIFAINNYHTAFTYDNKPQYIYHQAAIYDHKLNNPEKAKEHYELFLNALPDDLNPKKGSERYAIQLKNIVERRLTVIKEEDFFKNGIQ